MTKNGKPRVLPAIFRTPEMEAQMLLDDATNVIAQDLAHHITNLPFTVGKGMMIPMPLCCAAAEKIVNRFAGAVLAAIKGQQAMAELAALKAAPSTLAPDVIALVIACRELMDVDAIDGHQDFREERAAFGRAVEAFSSRVCYEDDGDNLLTHADPCTCGGIRHE